MRVHERPFGSILLPLEPITALWSPDMTCVRPWGSAVEGLYCKRPIKCLASSEILIPHPLTARRLCTPPPFGAWGGHCSVLYTM
jgi:hypothetical protein